MDHQQHSYCQPFNNHAHYHPASAPVPAPTLELELTDYDHTPASPSEFIYSSANTTASIFRPSCSSRSSRPSHPSFSNEPALAYPQTMGYGPSRPVEQSFPTYLPAAPQPDFSELSLPEISRPRYSSPRHSLQRPSLSDPVFPEPDLPEPNQPEPTPNLPEPTLGFEEHRRQRQRQSTMTMGPGPSKPVPPPLSFTSHAREKSRGSRDPTTVIKRETFFSSPVFVSEPLGPRMKKRNPQFSNADQLEQILFGKWMRGNAVPEEKGKGKGKGEKGLFDPFNGTTVTGMVNEIGDASGSGSPSGTWEDRGESVMEKVQPPTAPNISSVTHTGMVMGTDMAIPPMMPKLGLFKPINWNSPSSRSRVMGRRVDRAWEVEDEDGRVAALQRSYGNHGLKGDRNRNRDRNDDTDDEQTLNGPVPSASHSRSAKRRKVSVEGNECRTRSAETVIKQEPGLSPPPEVVFGRVPMYNHGTLNDTGPGYGSSSDDNNRSSRSISPLTRVPTPRRLLFPTPHPSRTETGGTHDRPSLRALSKQLKRRNREMASMNRDVSQDRHREQSRERRWEELWKMVCGSKPESPPVAHQENQNRASGSPRQQQQYRGSTEERGQDWATISISGSSEEGEVSSHYDSYNSHDSYSCGQERDTDTPSTAPRNNIHDTHHQSSPFLSYRDQHQEWYSQASTSPASSAPLRVPGVGSSSSVIYTSSPSLLDEERRVEQQRVEEQRVEQCREMIEMVKDTCLEASKRYLRAHFVNQQARGGGRTGVGPVLGETVEGRSARKVRRRRKVNTRHASPDSSSPSLSPSPPPSSSRQWRRGKGKRRVQNLNRTTTTPSSSTHPHLHPNSHPEIHATNSLLPNISQICTLLWSRSQSLRLHDTSSIELHTARNMYWLLEWAETVAFAVPPSSISSFSSSPSNGTSIDSSPFHWWGEASVENPAVGRRRPSSFVQRERERERDSENEEISMWDTLDKGGLGGDGYMWGMETEEEEAEAGVGGVEMRRSRNGEVCWVQQREEMGRVFEAGGAVCEFLGFGEGVERIARVRGFYGF